MNSPVRFVGLAWVALILSSCGQGSAAPGAPPLAAAVPPPRTLRPADAPAVVRAAPAPAKPAPVETKPSAPATKPANAEAPKADSSKPSERPGRPDDRSERGPRGFVMEAPRGEFRPEPASDSLRRYKTLTPPAGLPSWFPERDKDNDGQVGMYEWPRDGLEEFARLDRNGDGFITAEEAPKTAGVAAGGLTTPANGITPAPAGSAAPTSVPTGPTTLSLNSPGGNADERTRRSAEDMIRRYDRNNDNKLDSQEIQTTMMLRYSWQQHDANKDGVIDLDEATNYMKNMRGGPIGMGGGGGPPGGGLGGGFGGGSPGGFGRNNDRDRDRDRMGGGGGPPGGGLGGGGPGGFGRNNDRDRGGDRGGNSEDGMRRMIGRSDRNNDGKLSQDEWPFFFPKERFGELDTNKDGFVDAQEMAAGMANFRR